jgi:soluble lytic murein transglycosylase-like protein
VRIVLSILFATLTASAGEYAVLGNGFRIHADSHETEGAVVRLQTNQGVIEMQATAIARFESEDYAPPAAPETPPAVSSASPAVSPQELITRAAIQAGLPPEIVHSIARAESGYRIDAVSSKGAVGLMQLMPGTAAELNANPYDPDQNAQAGAQYLRELLLKYENDPHQVSKAVAAYNAGPAAVDKYNGIPPYRETIDYVSRVLREYEKEQKKKSPVTD